MRKGKTVIRKNIKYIILFFTALITSTLFLITGASFYLTIQHITLKDAKANAHSSSEQIFHSMYQIMKKGWKREDVLEFITSIESSYKYSDTDISLYRSEIVKKQFGHVPEDSRNDLVNRAFKTKKEFTENRNDHISFIKPLIADNECLKCHTAAKPGDVLGVIQISKDEGWIFEEVRTILLWLFVLSLPFAIIFSSFLAGYIRKRIVGVTNHINDAISGLRKVGDLNKLKLSNEKIDMEEIDNLVNEIKRLADKLQTIAIDKDVLELEIKLTEKLIITSDLVQEWKEYIKILLLEVNQIIKVDYLFTLFVDNEQLSIDLFWKATPDDTSLQNIEKGIRRQLAREEVLIRFEIRKITFQHHICDMEANLQPLTREDISNATKSIVLDKPRVGSIVGLGIGSKVVGETQMRLAIDSILATLVNVVGSARAISNYITEIEFYAMRDPLTYLYNQRIFWELLGYEVERGKRNKENLTIMFMDIDNFKYINDTYGHSAGDVALKELARIINETKRSGDIAARYGGDEFVIILTRTNIEAAYNLAKRFRKKVESLNISVTESESIKLTLSIGLSSFPYNGETPKDIFLVATAMAEKAKKKGKNQIAIPEFDDMAESIKESAKHAIFLIQALQKEDVAPFFQPIVDLKNGEIFAHEVLIRIGNKHTITEELVHTAEEIGLIQRFDYLMMEKTFQAIKELNIETRISINLAIRDILSWDFKKDIVSLIEEYSIDPTNLIFELTERESIDNIEIIKTFILQVKEIGASFAIDDIGSGYASFKYLKEFEADYVKIDGEFVKEMFSSPQDRAFVLSMVNLAKGMDMKIIAEFVESENILRALIDMEVEYGQGYFLGKPSSTLTTEVPEKARRIIAEETAS